MQEAAMEVVISQVVNLFSRWQQMRRDLLAKVRLSSYCTNVYCQELITTGEQKPKPHVIDLSADSDVDQEEQLPYQPPQTYKAAQQLASHERLVRLKTWLDDYPWTAKTTRCEILDAFMVLDKARVCSILQKVFMS